VFSQNWSITAESQHKTQVSESYRRTQPHISHSYTQTHRRTHTHTHTNTEHHRTSGGGVQDSFVIVYSFATTCTRGRKFRRRRRHVGLHRSSGGDAGRGRRRWERWSGSRIAGGMLNRREGRWREPAPTNTTRGGRRRGRRWNRRRRHRVHHVSTACVGWWGNDFCRESKKKFGKRARTSSKNPTQNTRTHQTHTEHTGRTHVWLPWFVRCTPRFSARVREEQ
jgi:hypothetical protein